MILENKYHDKQGKGLSEVIIRKMVSADKIQYCELFKNVFSQQPWNEQWTIQKIDSIVTRQMQKRGFFGLTAVLQSGIIGFLTGYQFSMIPSLFCLDQLFVHADYQGRRIGDRLLVEAEYHLKNICVSHIILLTKPGTVAERFYIRNEFMPFLPFIRIRGKSIFIKQIRKRI